jgi:hypothetical protein
MDRKEAQLILTALRPDGPEVNESPFAEALALAGSDPELKAWWQAQQEFDRKVAARLAEVPLPDGLRENILAAPKIVFFPPQWRHRSLLAAAAVVAFLCVSGTFWHVANSGPVDRSDFADQALAELDTSGPLLAMTSADHEKVREWLQSQNAPMGVIPAGFESLPTVGCQKYMIHGHAVSLICFSLANGGVAHLFVVEKSALNDPPDSSGMQFDNVKGWNIASWSDGRMTYMLATQSSINDLKQLLSS